MRPILPLVVALVAATSAAAADTPIHVRVLSQGAKFIGSTMGGVEIIIRDAETGAILARGLTEGSTGDTAKIMSGAPRNAPLSTPDSAVFRATVPLDEPRLLEVSARGPLAQPQAAVLATSRQWVLPGRGVTVGDGWLLELPGLVADLTEPAAQSVHQGIATMRLSANVALLCGCPIVPGGTWDANRFIVEAKIRRDGGAPAVTRLGYAGRTGLFAADVPVPGPGTYLVTLTAFDTATGAAGVDRTSYLVR